MSIFPRVKQRDAPHRNDNDSKLIWRPRPAVGRNLRRFRFEEGPGKHTVRYLENADVIQSPKKDIQADASWGERCLEGMILGSKYITYRKGGVSFGA